MNWLRSLIVLALALVMTTSTQAAGKKKKATTATGTIVEVKKDEGKDTGTLVVKVAVGKKKDNNTEEKTFKITDTTKIEKLQKAKKGAPAPAGTAIKLGDVAKGANVTLTLDGDKVTEAKIVATKKKAK